MASGEMRSHSNVANSRKKRLRGGEQLPPFLLIPEWGIIGFDSRISANITNKIKNTMKNLNTLLLDKKELNNFIDRLTTYGMECCDYYHKYNETLGYNSPTLSPSAREVFVHRTLNKWFSGKYLILYNTSNDLLYKQYLYIMSISYSNSYDYSGLLHITLMDYNISQVVRKTVKFDELFNFEGEWCDSPHEHNKLLFMTSFSSIPEKEYIFEAFDFE